MARFLDPVAGTSAYGYYWTNSFDDVIFYLLDLFDVYHESYLCTLHASAIFRHVSGEETELHMPPLQPVLFDPNAPRGVFDDEVQNLYDQLMDPERYESIEGSGWTIIPGTHTYWVNTISHQPNNNADENNRNSNTPPTDDNPDDPAYDNGPSHVLNDTLLLSIGAFHTPKSRHHTKLLYKKQCQRWVEEHGLSPAPGHPKIHMGSLAAWHESVYAYNIRVFSDLGNVIYNKDFGGPLIDLLWKNKKFTLITNLWGLLHEKRNRPFCGACKKFHEAEELCKQCLKAARSESVTSPELPRGKHSVVCYADFESYIKNNNHKPSGYCLATIVNDNLSDLTVVNALETEEIAEHFIKTLIQTLNTIAYSTLVTEVCQICEEPCTYNTITARNFINGKEGSHHKDCWEDMRNCAYVFFHNFRGYDSHYVLRECMKHADITTLRGKSFEKFDLISCTSGAFARYTFKDTFNFFPYSLAALVNQVHNWRYTPIEARKQKGVFPYDWFDDPVKLTYTSLPPQEFWYNKLTDSMGDWEEGLKVWNDMGMQTFSDYHNYYMKNDVLQLADAFEEFRDAVIAKFNTDPVYCQGSPSLTWQLCLQEHADKIKLIRDTRVYIDIQSNIRGGIAQVMTRHVDIRKKGGEILYLDINSLYSACMEEMMPTAYVAKLNELPHDWEKFCGEGEYTAFFNVDLHYPQHLHDKHRFYPLAPHKFNNRLCATFLDKENYLTHARNLKFYLDNGLVLIKFNYGYVFKQDKILKEYVSSNIEKRKEAARDNNKVLVALYKLLNNSLYGKTCENKFKYRKYRIKEPFHGIFGKKNPFLYKARNYLEMNEKILCEDDNSTITLDKPIQIGFTVLEFAKLKIYNFYYSLMNWFPEVELIYTDTDSLMMWFPYKEPQKRLIDSPLCTMFDFEKTPDWFNVRTINTDKVSGKWSLEADKPIVQFVGLRAKTYAIEFADGTSTLKNKGVVKTAKEEESRRPLEMADYLESLYQGRDIYVEQHLIRSRLHHISTATQRKLALSANDEKRVVLADKITTLPFGYQGDMYRDANVIQPSDDNL